MNRILIYMFTGFLFSAGAMAQEHEATDENLSPMNRVAMELYVDFTNSVDGEEFQILLVGNSLTLHGVAEDIGWFMECGMAASAVEKDYAHLLFRKLEKLMPDRRIHMRLSNSASFEREFESFDLGTVDKIMEGFNPDFILFQLGENVAWDADRELFSRKYTAFIKRFTRGNKTVTLCTTPFFPTAWKSEVHREVALQTNSFLVDLSSLPLLDEENYAKNEKDYPGSREAWKVEGIGVHPGDYGMENIAELIFITINALVQ
ncbi:MAG: hypothetical protein ABFS10_15325 [Bacteroidota bacterium]